jgi:hypothetical protein
MATEDNNEDAFTGVPAPDGAEPQDVGPATKEDPTLEPSDLALLKRVTKTIKADKKFHEPAFKKMREDMELARIGRSKGVNKDFYVANVVGRFVKQKVGSLYAKNPRIIASRRETLDFAVWDENSASIMLAMQTVQTGMQQAAMVQQGQPQLADPTTGIPTPPSAPELPQGFQQAQALIQDFQQGMLRRKQRAQFGQTLSILFAHGMIEQKPLDFKTAMKRVVRRSCTAGVAYCEVGYQREFGPRPGMEEALADARVRLEHMATLKREIATGDIDEDDAEVAELKATEASLQAEPEIVIREGLVFDYPAATRVIPDKACTGLVGFVNAGHITIEYLYPKDVVEGMFGVTLNKFSEHERDEENKDDQFSTPAADSSTDDNRADHADSGKLALVWKHYDKPSGLVYYLCDGYDGWLRPPAAPDVFVTDFWPVYVLTFNDIEHEEEIFPPSDVRLMTDMQAEFNRARQGVREHRRFARPRMAYANGALDEEDAKKLAKADAFEAIGLNIDPGADVNKTLMTIQVKGVDPNLYDTGELMSDMELMVGSGAAQLGQTSKATATESAIASGASAQTDSSAVDDLDAFLSAISRAGGQVLMKETPQEKVMRDVGPGAFWPPQPLIDIADEIYLEVQAGSSGKPNQAIEVKNWQMMLPFLIQMQAIDKIWLARETIRRLDDKADLDEAITANMPSTVAQNQLDSSPGPQPAPPGAPPGAPGAPPGPPGVPPQEDIQGVPRSGVPTPLDQPAPGHVGIPAAQGPHGGHNLPGLPGGPPGSGPAFGSNQR